MRVMIIGLLAALFFASTFVLNRAMDLAGGSWVWSAALRYFFTLPFLLAIVAFRRNLRPLLEELTAQPAAWIIWSTVGFGLFYAPLCFAAAYGPAWMAAGTWQITIVAGSLLVPLFYHQAEPGAGGKPGRQKIPARELLISAFILLGVVFIQTRDTAGLEPAAMLAGVLPVVIAAFAYPLGNRKMMVVCAGRLDVFQRVLGMTIASLPFWLVLSLYGAATAGPPAPDQLAQTLLVAVLSGIIATVLFFYATDKAQGDPRKLAIIEATQAGEVVFTVIGEVLFLAGAVPSGWPLAGIVIIVTGMILHSLNLKPAEKTAAYPENSGSYQG
ncbi:multidrug resistance efflux transporter family protein|uniref:Putative multidrug resistance efflux transporter n=2 Tax=Dendrosporobacter quercicolus TaxID=146817 RepID=A0A1G9W6L2_9FIRM|nr:multidrug resistance efflux transporter family protein [Dendrosporobacter quercicolus DSM 1736]SDM80139.1 Putative multidrug resistance efflux transporter [Dendrosporobacter quercicolus]